ARRSRWTSSPSWRARRARQPERSRGSAGRRYGGLESMKKVLAGLGAVLVLVVVAIAVYVASPQNLKFNPPLPPVMASADPAVIERGHYVVRNLATCPVCHGDPKQHERTAAGEEVPLSGGFEFVIPPGKVYPRNITPDPETGIGRFSDGEIARALRY